MKNHRLKIDGRKLLGRLSMLGALLLFNACFPYRQTYRGPVQGIVLDQAKNPVPGAEVVLCSTDGWHSLKGCPRRGETRTDDAGRFLLPEHVEWEWCCFGEAPRPLTYLTTCALDDNGELLAVDRLPITTTGDAVQYIVLKPHEGLTLPLVCSPPQRRIAHSKDR